MKRSWHSLTLVAVVGMGVLSLAAADLSAQNPNPGGLEIVELSGKLVDILGNQVKLKATDGQETIVLVGDQTNFLYTGTAEPSVLTPGLMVRFTAAFDPSGVPAAPLAELEVFRPVKMRRMSFELRQSQTPGIYPVDDQAEAKADKPAPNNKSKQNSPPANANKADPNQVVGGLNAAGLQKFKVVGLVGGIQGDTLQIVAGNVPLLLQADPGLKISVSSGDPVFCQAGDDIKLTGLKSPAGLIQAETIAVTGAKPLGTIDEKAQVRNKRVKPGGKEPAQNNTPTPLKPKR